MVDQVIEIIIPIVCFTSMGCFWLALCHMMYLAYFRKICGKKNSEHPLDKTEAMFYVTELASDTSESHQEDHPSIVLSLLYDQYDV